MIEIVGIGCRFPGGVNSADLFWNLLNGKESAICEIPNNRWEPRDFSGGDSVQQGRSLTFRAGWLDQIDHFDAGYFRLSQREAAEMDPQQRLMMEVAHEALFDANINPQSLNGNRVGVFVGAGMAESLGMAFSDPTNMTAHTMSGNSLGVIANRLSYLLNLDGPSLTVDTACSSALTALYLACQSLSSGDCDLAIVGGVNAMLGPSPFIGLSQAHMLSPRGICSPFDADGDGFVRAEGCGVLVLGRGDRPVHERRRVYAEIIGWEANEDGKTASLTIPSGDRQISLMQRALNRAGVSPEQVVYIEAHGTGTPVGDPIEASAIATAIVGNRRSPLAIGSAKGHTGHMETAAGIVGLTKAALCLYHRQLVPTAGHRQWSPKIDADALHLRIPTEAESLPESEMGGEPIIGVCSYGFGGANAFALLKPAGNLQVSDAQEPAQARVLALSAHRPDSLATLDAQFSAFQPKKLSEAACWAGIALPALRHRRVRLAENGDMFGPNAAVFDGEAKSEAPRLVFAYGGQGSQHPSMGKLLYEQFPAFRRAIEEADRLYAGFAGHSLVERYGFCQREMHAADLSQVLIALPCIIMTQVGLTTLLREAGVRPSAVVGHSTGEMTGAWACGAISLETLMRLTWERATAQDRMQPGAMAAWTGSEQTMAALLQKLDIHERVVIAARNGDDALTLAGDCEAIDMLVSHGKRLGIRTTKLNVPRAYHSPHVDSVLPELRERLCDVAAGSAAIPFVSTVAGMVGQTPGETLSGTYWLHNIRQMVDFDAGARAVTQHGDLFVEISPSPVLSGYLAANHELGVVTSQHNKATSDLALLQCLAELFVRGVDVNWAVTQAPSRFVSIPRVDWHHDAPLRSATWKVPATATPFALQMVDGPLELSREVYSFLDDHKVEGQSVMPGAGLVSLALTRKSKPMRNIEFRRFLPLWTANGKTILEWSRDGERWQWVADGTSRLSCTFADGLPPIETETLENVQGRCSSNVDTRRLYDALRRHSGLDFGPSFQSLAELRVGDAEAVARIAVPDRVPQGWAHDAVLLDGCFQALAALRGLDVHCYVPTRIGAVDWLSDTQHRELWCHVIIKDVGKDWAEGDITIWDANGTVAGRIGRLRLQRIRSPHAAVPETFTVIHEPRGVPEDIRSWDWSDPGPCLTHLYQVGTIKRTLRILDLSTSLLSLSALQTVSRSALERCAPFLVAAAAVPAGSPSWCHALDTAAPPEVLSFDIVIGDTGGAWVAPEGVLVPWESTVALPQALQSSASSPLRAYLLGDGLDAWPTADMVAEIDLATVVIDARESLEDASALVKQISGMDAPPALVFLIRDDASGPPSPLWGFARAARNEQPQLRIYAIGLSKLMAEGDASRLLSLCKSGLGADTELRWDGATWRVSRLVAIDVPPPPKTTGEMRLEVAHPGQLSSLRWRSINPAHEGLDPDEIRIRVHAVPLNFKDVMLALGMLPSYAPVLGMECCGTIVEVGADVPRLYPELQAGRKILALALTAQRGEARRTLFSTMAVVQARNAILKPDNIDDVDGAGFLGAYTTAWYALNHVAQLKAGETVLIHSAAGGVGQATVQVARTLGANIIASAGTEEKRAYLRDVLGLDKVFDSHYPAQFRETISTMTHGHGVDVVLNSLAGDGLRESLHCLAPGGRHVEIGKRDILEDSALGLFALKNNISFHSVHLDGLAETHPQRVRALVEECVARLKRGDALPLPATAFPAERAIDAFRFMSSGDHIGKVTITMPDAADTFSVSQLPVNQRIPQAIFSVDDTLLVTGGTGGVGLALARFLAEHGAGRILLAGRHSGTTDRAALAVNAIRRDHPRCRIEIVALDLCNHRQLDDLFRRETTLTGVLHLATSFRAERATEIENASLETWSVKAEAAWRLHQLTVNRNLRHFVLFSSLGGLHGNTQQAVYVAANAALHDLARRRRAQNLPALAIDLPILLGAGRLSEANHLLELQLNTGKGFTAISFSDIEASLERLLANPLQSPPVVALDAPRWRGYWGLSPKQRSFFAHLVPREALVAESVQSPEARIEDGREIELAVRTKVAALLGAKPGEIEPDAPLADLGLDSLAAVELLSWAREQYDVEISQTRLLTGATARTLADIVLERTGPKHISKATGFADTGAIEKSVREKVAALLGATPEEIEPDAALADLGLDSLAAVELLSWAREQYGIEISQTQLLTGATARTLADKAAVHSGPSITANSVEPWETDEIASTIRNKVAALLGAKPDEVERDTPLADLGLDSLSAVELLSWARETYGIEVSQTQLLTGTSVEMLANQVIARSGRTRAATTTARPQASEPAVHVSDVPAPKPVASMPLKSAVAARHTSEIVVTEATSSLVPVPLYPAEQVRAGERIIHLEPTLTTSLVEQLSEDLLENPSILVIRAAPGSEHFCLGMDLDKVSFGDVAMSDGLERFADLATCLENASMPIICVVEGNCRGGGMLFPSLASVVLATDTATFGFPEIRRNGLPGVVSVAAQRRLSIANCRRMMLTGDTINAETAKQYGLVDFVGSRDEVEQELKRLLGRFATIDPALIHICQTQCPAPDIESALVTMGSLGHDAIEATRQTGALVRVLHGQTDGIAIIELDDPAHSNAIDRSIAEDLRSAVTAVQHLNDVRAVIVQGSGTHFCVGVNPYRLMEQMKQSSVLAAAHSTYEIYRAFASIRELAVPVICVVQGKVVGGGLAAMLNADYRVCTADAIFNFGNLPRGVCPGMFLSESLERVVGWKWATELYLNDYTLSADQALAIGLVNEIRPNLAEAQIAAQEMARRIGQYPDMGVRATTALMRPPLDYARLARESLGIARCTVRGAAFTGAWHGEIRPALSISGSPSLPPGTAGDNATAPLALQEVRARNVGIKAMELYFPNHMVLQSDMELHHHCEGKYTVGLGQEAITFCGDDEDAVSMALTVVQRLMDRYGIDWSQIGRLEIGTESQVDRSKSIKSYLMQLFEAHGCCNIEGVDTYNACYGGTSALFNTVAWCQSEAWDGRLGLVVCVDIADLSEEHAFLNGAAAVAMLVGPDAALVMKPERASHMLHRWDFYKPVAWHDPFPLMRDGKHSVDVYTACLDSCQNLLDQRLGGKGLLGKHDHFVFHCTSTYLIKRAFDRIIENEMPTLPLREKRALYESMVHPSSLLTRQIGSSYTASVYVNLYSLLLNRYDDIVGKTIGVYSYGSGASASFYRLEVMKAPQIDLDVDVRLRERRRHDPSSFVQLTQEYSSAYGRFNYVPIDRDDRLEGVYYLRKVDEWGQRTYTQETRSTDRRESATGVFESPMRKKRGSTESTYE
ncbi:type I polyketide synthase [Burkholderia ubonensis]|uniref:type I polyketide synthase n=1 Tax=Burkholderia ubonensis TaxID=101571 RepID=UPI0009B4A44C|nr:type I polyketide synthase [Burkholderia ubonensis]